MPIPPFFQQLPANLWHLLFPPLCLLCSRQPQRLCSQCWALLASLRATRPFLSLPPYVSTYAPWHYAFPLDQLLNRFKHQQQLSLLRLWQEMLELPVAWPAKVDAIVPVPLHPSRQFHRGFNQSALLAHSLAKRYRIPLLQPLERITTEHQQGKSRVQRLHQPLNPFRLRRSVQGLRLLVVDDVLTTGSTLQAVASCLQQGQPGVLRALALCQVPDQSHYPHSPDNKP